jgi:hypothetical protein
MATILPFPATRGGDWTPGERARLDELAARFAGESGVEVVFGRSDAGDPFCVLLDAGDEVLVHIAREGGSFVAHTADDLFFRAADLRTAVERVLGSRWNEERGDVVVPFAAGGRSVQVVTAILVVASFVQHHSAEAEPADDWSFAAARPLKAGSRDSRDQAAKTVVAIDAEPVKDFHAAALPPLPHGAEASAAAFAGGPEPLFVETPPPAHGAASAASASAGIRLAAQLIETARSIGGTPEADVLVGTAGDDLIDAGKAPPMAHDLVDGGGGDDRIMIEDGTVAIGGDGADSFAIRAPAAPGPATLLGVLVDFDPGVDTITNGAVVTRPGDPPAFTVISNLPLDDIFTDPGVSLRETVQLPALPGSRMTVDLDGDGRPDGYLLVNGSPPNAAMLDAVRDAFMSPPATDPAPLAPAWPPAAIAPGPEPIHAVLAEVI